MILLISACPRKRYRSHQAMDYQAECLATLAHLLESPDHAFVAHLALATDPAVMPPLAAGHVALFAERVAGLSLDEYQELFAETFRSVGADRERRAIVFGLRAGRHHTDSVRRSLSQLDGPLLNDRNPYHHLLVAVGALLA